MTRTTMTGAARPIDESGVSRRTLFALGAATLAGPVRIDRSTLAHRMAMSTSLSGQPPIAEQIAMIVGGPAGGTLDRWADMIAATLGPLLPDDRPLKLSHVGGADGVTAANQFEARTTPDGSTALLISGAPAIAWLSGDPRAQFDAGHWLPVLTALTCGVVIGRSRLVPGGSRLRLASRGTAELALPARLGLSMLGAETDDITEAEDPVAMLLSGRCEAIFLRGPNAASDARKALAKGAVSLFSLGVSDETGALQRDPDLAEIAVLTELLQDRPHSTDMTLLTSAWRAVAAASQLEFALLLPWLTPPGTVAWWRKAGTQIATGEHADTGATSASMSSVNMAVRMRADPARSFGVSALSVDAGTSLALRRWIAADAR